MDMAKVVQIIFEWNHVVSLLLWVIVLVVVGGVLVRVIISKAHSKRTSEAKTTSTTTKSKNQLLLLLPPSPPLNLPIIGHIHLLPSFSRSSMQLIHQYSRLLGPVFSIRFGSVTTIFVTSAPLICHALLQNGAVFSSRVQSPAFSILNYNFRDINSSNGLFWRSARKNLSLHVFSPSSLQAFRASRQRALDFAMALFRRGDAERLGTMPVLRMGLLHYAISMCFGFAIDDELLLSQISATLEELSALIVPLVFSDFYPFLRPIISYGLRRKTKNFLAKQRHLLLPLIDQHRQKKQKQQHLIPGSYVETLFQQVAAESDAAAADDDGSSITAHDILPLTSEFLEGNVTTLATTVEWTLAHLIDQPAIQEKLSSHIRELVGDRPVREEDLSELPYLQAVVLETLRMHPPVPNLLPRETTEMCELGGYEIPAGAVVSFCVASVAMDAAVWEDPTEYRPERMMGLEVDITGTRKVTMLPFGAGRRFCPGMAVARTNVQLVVARAVQEFQWLLPSSSPGTRVDFSGTMRLTLAMAHPLKPLLLSRSPPHNSTNSLH